MKNEEAIASIRDFNQFYTNVVGLLDKHILKSPIPFPKPKFCLKSATAGNVQHGRLKKAL